jgi:hypothetical protein
MSSGRVDEILISPAAAVLPLRVERVLAIAGRGLEDDRYTNGVGTWSDYPVQTGIHLTLIEAEVLEAVGLSGAEARRNLVTRGIRLNDLVGRHFRVGQVDCYADRLCEPCAHIAHITGVSIETLVGRGGIRADIISGGHIATGDTVHAIATDESTTPRPQAESSDNFRRLLARCRLPATPSRRGLVALSAPCVAQQLAATGGINLDNALRNLERWAQALGGALDSDRVLWLPAEQVDSTPSPLHARPEGRSG